MNGSVLCKLRRRPLRRPPAARAPASPATAAPGAASGGVRFWFRRRSERPRPRAPGAEREARPLRAGGALPELGPDRVPAAVGAPGAREVELKMPFRAWRVRNHPPGPPRGLLRRGRRLRAATAGAWWPRSCDVHVKRRVNRHVFFPRHPGRRRRRPPTCAPAGTPARAF